MRSALTHQTLATDTTPADAKTDIWETIAGAAILALLVWAVIHVVGMFTTPTATDGVCREYRNSVVVCVPAFSPGGAELTRMWEDGSAVYVDGYVFGGYSEV